MIYSYEKEIEQFRIDINNLLQKIEEQTNLLYEEQVEKQKVKIFSIILYK